MKSQKTLIISTIFLLLLVSPLASADFSIQPIVGPIIPIIIQPITLSAIEQINQAIVVNGAGWTAAENSISSMTPEERNQMLGINKSLVEKQTIQASNAGFSVMAALPQAFDWRNKDGKNFITSVKDQGRCGSCWAFAAVGAMEAELNINSNNSSFNPDLSEQQLISCCPNCGSCNGGLSERAFDYAINPGLVKENWFGYDASNRQCNLSNYWQDTVKKITDWHYIDAWNNISLNHLKNEIVNGGPAVIYLDVYDDFFYYNGGVYHHLWGAKAGSHAMLLVGYNDAGRYLIAKNSWGSWGEGGYIKISYDDVYLIWGAMAISETDRDADGIQDKADNCPDIKNSDQNDTDKDGIGDICDNCPSLYNSDQNDSNKNGCGDVCDSGICAKQELCSHTINITDFHIVPATISADASCPGKFSDNYDTDEKNLYIDHPQVIFIHTFANDFVTSDHWVDPIFSWGARGKYAYKEVGVGDYAVGAKASCGPWMGGDAETEVGYEKREYFNFNDTVYTAEGCLNLDSDNDGLKNNEDKCIYVPGPLSNSGCPVCSDNICAKFALLEDFENVSDWKKECGSLYNECDVLKSFSRTTDAVAGSSMAISSSSYSGCWTGKVGKVFSQPVNLSNYSTISFYAKKGNSTYGSYSPSLAVTLVDSKGNSYIYGNYLRCGGITSSDNQWQQYKFDLPSTLSDIKSIHIDLYSSGWGSTSPADLLIDQMELKQTECVANWTYAFTVWGSCSVNDTKTRTKYYYDNNNCNKSNQYLNVTETASCDYCNSTWQNINSSCRADNTFTIGYVYTNTCCISTGLISDCNIPLNATGNCEYCTANLVNTSWSAWTNTSSCYSNNTLAQSRSLVQYDSNNCGKINNQTFYLYQSIACMNQSIQNIVCSSNSDCGEDGFAGNIFCSNGDVVQNYRIYKCIKPGTANSSCSYSYSNQTKETCQYGCENAACSAQTCTSHSYSDCYDNDIYWFDSCNAVEEKRMECGDNSTGDNYCYNNSVYKDYGIKRCFSNGCQSYTEKRKQQDCPYGCENGACKAESIIENQTASITQTNATNQTDTSSQMNNTANQTNITQTNVTNQTNTSQTNITNQTSITCISHNHKDCYNDNVYWFDSCNNKEELIYYCETSPLPGNSFCDGNSVYRYYIPRGCASGFCVEFNGYNTVKEQDCQYGCENGACKSLPPPKETSKECPYACCIKMSGYPDKPCTKGYRCMNNKCLPYL